MNKAVLILLSAVLLFACSREQIHPAGSIIQRERNLTGFSAIEVNSGMELVLKQDSSEKVVIETYENIQNIILSEKIGNLLVFKLPPNTNIQRDAKIRIFVSVKNLTALKATGGSRISSQTVLKFPSLIADISGGGGFSALYECNSMSMNLSGGSYFRATGGAAKDLNLIASGGSNFDAFDFSCDNFTCDASGGSRVNITVNSSLRVKASGGSEINYRGSGNVVFADLSGGSKLNKR
jgi:hypothetical protein